MKFLLLLAVLTVAYYIWRAGRRSAEREQPPPDKPARASTPASPQDMVQCASCAVHLPRSDALPGRGGAVYCSDEHRQRSEG